MTMHCIRSSGNLMLCLQKVGASAWLRQGRNKVLSKVGARSWARSGARSGRGWGKVWDDY